MFEKFKKLFQEDLSPASEELHKIVLRNLEDNKKHYQEVLTFIEEFEKSDFLKNFPTTSAKKNWRG